MALNAAPIHNALHLPEPDETIQTPAVEAIRLAAERLGPFPGGQLGSFKGPDADPHIVDEVEPTDDDLIQMASTAGKAVNAAIKRDKITLRNAVRPIVAP